MTVPANSRFIAVVDDDPSVLRSLESLLDSADYRVRLFNTGEALVESGCLPEIACLISDIDMPGMDGFELLRTVLSLRPGLPTILITGYPETLGRLPTLGGPTPRVLTKPFAGQALLLAVQDSLRGPIG